ncbi:CbiX/SirB N-terminal domain-containing protein, partial [Synechococcus sp. GFB01]|uniref:CbiX/SirB N-terminal domain-containing protein n=1 Tax=Synechococcus sp. GFB01 TaxID=1662190 RepID=UPI000AC29959
GALEGVAVGLSAWPLPLITAGLEQLAGDLDSALAAAAVDLLARLPDGQRQLRQLQGRRLDPDVAARLQRRLQRSPLVLVVHGRQGGVIPAVYHELARSLEQRRGAPVLLQALTGVAPQPDARFRLAGRRAGAITLVPLLLLPGEHVRGDLPALAAAWRAGWGVRTRGLRRQRCGGCRFWGPCPPGSGCWLRCWARPMAAAA